MSAKLVKYDIVNVFIHNGNTYSGNPLAVFETDTELSQSQCQTLARQLNLSETTFPAKASVESSSYHVRIFTPMREVPFAGHPTLGTAFTLLHKNLSGCKQDLIQQSASGTTEVSFRTLAQSPYESARIYMRAKPHFLTDRLKVGLDKISSALGLSKDQESQVGFVRRSSCGLPWTFVQFKDVNTLRQANATYGPICALSEEVQAHLPSQFGQDTLPASCAAFSIVDSSSDELRIEARIFFNANGVMTEDPATGSAALALGLVLAAERLLPATNKYAIAQGAQVGAPSSLYGSVEVDEAGDATHVTVGGDVLKVGEGTFVVPSP